METQLLYRKLITTGSFHCSLCKNILQSPVWIVQGQGNLCNSCHQILIKNETVVHIQNLAMEKLLEEMCFPCPFEKGGCPEFLKYNTLLKHSSSCSYKPKNKCVFPTCKWIGVKFQFWEHILEAHKDDQLVSDNDIFDINFIEEFVYVMKVLLTSCGRFITQIKKDQNIFRIVIHDTDRISANLKFTFNIKHISGSGQAIKFKCKIAKNVDQLLNFDKEYVTEFLMHSSGTAECFLKFKVNDNREIMSSSMLNFFRCTYCKQYLKSVIFECDQKHFFCADCEKKSHQRDCSAALRRNEQLEMTVKNVKYPCLFEKYGCRAKISLMEEHESVCEYKSWSCPVDGCQHAESASRLVNHVSEMHAELCVFDHITEFASKEKSYYFIIYNDIFKLECKFPQVYNSYSCTKEIDKNSIQCGVTQLGINTKYDFVFEIGAFKLGDFEKKVIQNGKCTRMGYSDVLKFPNGFIYRVAIMKCGCDKNSLNE